MRDYILPTDTFRRSMRSGVWALILILCLLWVRQMGVLHALEHTLGDEHTTDWVASSGPSLASESTQQPQVPAESAHEVCWLCLALADAAHALATAETKLKLDLVLSPVVATTVSPMPRLVRIWHWLARGPPVIS
jgi:hypothetical protein